MATWLIWSIRHQMSFSSWNVLLISKISGRFRRIRFLYKCKTLLIVYNLLPVCLMYVKCMRAWTLHILGEQEELHTVLNLKTLLMLPDLHRFTYKTKMRLTEKDFFWSGYRRSDHYEHTVFLQKRSFSIFSSVALTWEYHEKIVLFNCSEEKDIKERARYVLKKL